MKLEINYKKKIGKLHKYMEIKQHGIEQPMGQQWTQNRNLKNTLKLTEM